MRVFWKKSFDLWTAVLSPTRNFDHFSRYHEDPDNKYGQFRPGRLSGRLRNALGIRHNQLAEHIYRMRLIGYPPGWLKEAEVHRSDVSVIGSDGKGKLQITTYIHKLLQRECLFVAFNYIFISICNYLYYILLCKRYKVVQAELQQINITFSHWPLELQTNIQI